MIRFIASLTHPVHFHSKFVRRAFCSLSQDKIILKGLVFHGFHGVYESEKILGQKFVLDVECSLDLKKPGTTGALSDTVNYALLVKDITGVVCGERHDLIEAVGESVVSLILSKYPRIQQVKILVKKPHIALEGVLDYVGVELTRRRELLPKE